jgi:hypothetical protein
MPPKLDRATLILSVLRIDISSKTLDTLHRAIESEIVRSNHRAEGNEALIDDESDLLEELLGLAFVANQVFINRICTRMLMLNQIFQEDSGRPLTFMCSNNIFEILKRGKRLRNKSKLYMVEAMYALANFWKHSDEWRTCEVKKGTRVKTGWDISQMRSKSDKRTAEIATALGLSPGSTGNLRRAAEAFGISDFQNLRPIRDTLQQWADDLHKAARAELQQHRQQEFKRGRA